MDAAFLPCATIVRRYSGGDTTSNGSDYQSRESQKYLVLAGRPGDQVTSEYGIIDSEWAGCHVVAIAKGKQTACEITAEELKVTLFGRHIASLFI